MLEVVKDYPRFKSWAKKLASYNKNKFEKQKIFDNFINCLGTSDDTTIIL
jgi:hypothetical protein